MPFPRFGKKAQPETRPPLQRTGAGAVVGRPRRSTTPINPLAVRGLIITTTEDYFPRDLVVQIPSRLLSILATVNAHVGGREWGILAKIKRITGNVIELDSDFYMPRQKTSDAAIVIEESLSDLSKRYDVFIHSHPPGVEDFSVLDRDSVNRYFRLSVLFMNGRPLKAELRVEIAPRVFVIVPVSQFTVSPAPIDGSVLSKIGHLRPVSMDNITLAPTRADVMRIVESAATKILAPRDVQRPGWGARALLRGIGAGEG